MESRLAGLLAELKKPRLMALLLGAMAFWLYSPAIGYDFVNYDDQLYVFENPHVLNGLDFSGVSYAFRTSDGGSWMPLTWLSFMLDTSIFGTRPNGYHLTNILLHAVSAAALFLALSRMTGLFWPSAFVAVLFAAYPLRLESVVWIGERKDTLSALFWMTGMLAYAHHVEKPGWKRYALVFVCLLLGLMSKPMLVTFPFALLLLDHWPLRRTGNNWQEFRTKMWPLCREKIPLLLLCLLFAGLTVWTQYDHGAMSDRTTPQPKLLRIAENYFFYACKILWPSQLSVLYPVEQLVVWRAAAGALLIGVLSGLSLRWLFRFPWLATGWFWFLGTLIPVVGVVRVGDIHVADRYTYIPSIGLTILVTWAVLSLVQRRSWSRPFLTIAGATLFVLCVAATRANLPRWHDSTALFEDAISKGGHCTAYSILGAVYHLRGEFDKSVIAFTKAIELDPAFAEAFSNRGLARSGQGNFDEAMKDFARAIELKPDYANAYNARGATYLKMGERKHALADFDAAIRLKNDFASAYSNRGGTYVDLGDYAAAIRDCTEAIRCDPALVDAWNNRGNAHGRSGDVAAALADYNQSINLKPDEAVYYNNRASAYFSLGQYPQASADLEKCRELGGQPHPGLVHDLDEAIKRKAVSP